MIAVYITPQIFFKSLPLRELLELMQNQWQHGWIYFLVCAKVSFYARGLKCHHYNSCFSNQYDTYVGHHCGTVPVLALDFSSHPMLALDKFFPVGGKIHDK
jgi:hypothetical protein